LEIDKVALFELIDTSVNDDSNIQFSTNVSVRTDDTEIETDEARHISQQ
jgi:hypothetical protein